MATAEQREPYESRGSCTVLGESPEVKVLRATRHSRRFADVRATSELPQKADILSAGWHVSNAPKPEVFTAESQHEEDRLPTFFDLLPAAGASAKPASPRAVTDQARELFLLPSRLISNHLPARN
jgi:hypothetical protein